MPRSLKNVLEWIGHFETVQAIINTEFVRTLLVPSLMGVMTASAGYFGGIPLMWILMATALAFMATMQGLLRTSEFMERKNPLNKLSILQIGVGLDLTPLPTPNRLQRRSG
jgi:hypothetical protein